MRELGSRFRSWNLAKRLNAFSRSLTPQGSPKMAQDTIALPQCRQVHKRMKVSNKITLTGLKKTPIFLAIKPDPEQFHYYIDLIFKKEKSTIYFCFKEHTGGVF